VIELLILSDKDNALRFSFWNCRHPIDGRRMRKCGNVKMHRTANLDDENGRCAVISVKRGAASQLRLFRFLPGHPGQLP